MAGAAPKLEGPRLVCTAGRAQRHFRCRYRLRTAAGVGEIEGFGTGSCAKREPVWMQFRLQVTSFNRRDHRCASTQHEDNYGALDGREIGAVQAQSARSRHKSVQGQPALWDDRGRPQRKAKATETETETGARAD